MPDNRAKIRDVPGKLGGLRGCEILLQRSGEASRDDACSSGGVVTQLGREYPD